MKKIAQLELIITFPRTHQDLENSLEEIENIKSKIDHISPEYIYLSHLECIAHQKICEIGYCTIEEAFNHLVMAKDCILNSIEILSNHNITSPINLLIDLQELACTISMLGKFSEEQIDYLNDALSMFEFIRENESDDQQLIHLTYMNEAKARINLATLNIDKFDNCLKSLELSEKARDYFDESDHRYEITILNQIYVILELNKIGSYGFKIVSKDIIKKLYNKIEKKDILPLKIKMDLIELGIKDISELDNLLEEINEIIISSKPYEHIYQEAIVLKEEIFIKKSQMNDDNTTSIINLLECLNYHSENISFHDSYYAVQFLIKQSYARYCLSKLEKIHRNTNLNDSLETLLECKDFYETVPFQNKELFYPIVLLYLSKIKKELAIDNNSMKTEEPRIKEYLLDSLRYFKDNNDQEKITECYLELGDLFFKIKDYNKSYYYLKKGITLIEFMRASIHNFSIKKNFFEKVNKVFELMILTCYQSNRYNEALKFIELSKHRIFLDEIIEKQKIKQVIPIDKELLNKLDNIESEIEITVDKLKNCDKYEYKISAQYKEFFDLKKQQEKYLNKIKTDYPDYFNYYYNQFFDYTEIDLKNKTLIEYYYTEEILLICLIEKEKINIKHVDLKDTNLLNFINEFKENIKRSEYNNEYEHALDEITKIMEQLYNILIKPIESEISNNDLLIIPYKELHNIPFYCLKKNNKYLIDAYTITIAQSGTSIKYLENNAKQSNNESLVIGIEDEELSHTIKEAKFISEKLGTKPLLNENVTKENVLNSIEGKSIIHFAGHGCYNPKNPLESHLKLFDENLLIKDIENKNIDSELITLSACETGIVSADETDDTISFITSLHLDGVKYIIASLWPVFDDSTIKIFKYFYDSTEEYSKRLRLAQLELKKEKDDLLRWGGFQIYGI